MLNHAAHTNMEKAKRRTGSADEDTPSTDVDAVVVNGKTFEEMDSSEMSAYFRGFS